MSIFRKLTEKPWLTPSVMGEDVSLSQVDATELAQISVQARKIRSARTALMFFLVIVSVLFLLITITFLGRSQYPDFQALAGEPWLPFTRPAPLWLNTSFLLLASIAIQIALSMANKAKPTQALIALFAVCIFTANFLSGQFAVWRQLMEFGFVVSSNPANSYFYLFTSIHGLHLLAGFIALLRAVFLFWDHSDLPRLKTGINLLALYWHYLFIVWLFLFALLTATSETYRTVAVLCGF